MLSLSLVLMMAAGAAAAVDLAEKFTLTEGVGVNGVGYTVVTPTSEMCVGPAHGLAAHLSKVSLHA